MGDDHDPGLGYASYGFGPAKTTLPAPAARIGVYIGAAMSMPLWKWAQLPCGGSHAKPVHPNSWVTLPAIGQMSVPLYYDGMLPRFACWRMSCLILLVELALGRAAAGERLAALVLLRMTWA